MARIRLLLNRTASVDRRIARSRSRAIAHVLELNHVRRDCVFTRSKDHQVATRQHTPMQRPSDLGLLLELALHDDRVVTVLHELQRVAYRR